MKSYWIRRTQYTCRSSLMACVKGDEIFPLMTFTLVFIAFNLRAYARCSDIPYQRSLCVAANYIINFVFYDPVQNSDKIREYVLVIWLQESSASSSSGW